MVRWCLSLRLSLNCTVLMAPRVSLERRNTAIMPYMVCVPLTPLLLSLLSALLRRAVRTRQPTNKRAGGQPGGTRAFAPTKEDGVTAGEHTGEHWLVGYQTATRGSMLVRRRERSASSKWESLQGRSKFAGGCCCCRDVVSVLQSALGQAYAVHSTDLSTAVLRTAPSSTSPPSCLARHPTKPGELEGTWEACERVPRRFPACEHRPHHTTTRHMTTR